MEVGGSSWVSVSVDQNEPGHRVRSVPTHISRFCPPRAQSSRGPNPPSTPSTGVLPREHLSPPRATRPLREMADSWLGAGRAPDDSQQLKTPRVLQWTLLPFPVKGITGSPRVRTGQTTVCRRHAEGLGWQLTRSWLRKSVLSLYA